MFLYCVPIFTQLPVHVFSECNISLISLISGKDCSNRDSGRLKCLAYLCMQLNIAICQKIEIWVTFNVQHLLKWNHGCLKRCNYSFLWISSNIIPIAFNFHDWWRHPLLCMGVMQSCFYFWWWHPLVWCRFLVSDIGCFIILAHLVRGETFFLWAIYSILIC